MCRVRSREPVKAGALRGAPASLTHHEFVVTRQHLADHYRLKQANLTNGQREFGERFLVYALPRLARVGRDRSDRYFLEVGTGYLSAAASFVLTRHRAYAPGTRRTRARRDKGTQAPPKTSPLLSHRNPRSPQSRRCRAPAPEHDNTLSADGREHWVIAQLGRRKVTEHQVGRGARGRRGERDARGWAAAISIGPVSLIGHAQLSGFATGRAACAPRTVRTCPHFLVPAARCVRRSRSRQGSGEEPTRRGTRWTADISREGGASVRGAAGIPTGPATRGLHLRLSSGRAEPRLGPRLGARPRLSVPALPRRGTDACRAGGSGSGSDRHAKPSCGAAGKRFTARHASGRHRVRPSAASPSHMQRLLGER